MSDLPTGTVTFLFSDIEGSSRLWQEHPAAMEQALARHDALLRESIETQGGHVVKMRGDGVHAVFASAVDGVTAALQIQQSLVEEDWPQAIGPLGVRIGLHTGHAQLREGDYFGPTVNQAARLQDIGHGGQTLLSEATRAVVRDGMPDNVSLLDLGEHRIRDFPRPERVFQLSWPELKVVFPPLKSLSQGPSNLPAQPTPIIGREAELSDLAALLDDPQQKLVTIVGPGGIGKTRLSLAAAERIAEGIREPLNGETLFPDGVHFVHLAPLESPANIVSAIAEAVDYRFYGEVDPWWQLLNYLGQKRMLLVLDNFEHLLEGGAALVAELLGEAPAVKLLTTSRERLHLTGEAVYRISGLAYPKADEDAVTVNNVADYGSIQLMLHHARLMKPDHEPDESELVEVARICRLVQGMPLAIVLAAGWLEMLSFREIGDEIADNLDILESENRDMPARQRSVRAAIAQSWERLSRAEKEAFMKISVFRGGFTRQAARKIANAGLRALRALVEKSLIISLPAERYGVHELLREFAAEELAKAELEGDTQRVHSAYYLHAMSIREAELKGSRQVQALKAIERDLENVRAAWKWALQRREEDTMTHAIESLFLFFNTRGRHQEGAALLHEAREALDEGGSSRLLARIITRESWLHIAYLTDPSQLETDLAKSLSIAQQHDDESEVAFANLALGSYHSLLTRDFAAAIPFYETSRANFQAIGDNFYLALALVHLGYGYGMSNLPGGTDAFIEYTLQGLELARQMGDKMRIAAASNNLAWGYTWRGEYSAAVGLLNETVAVAEELGDRITLAHAATHRALLHLLRGELARAMTPATKGLVTAAEIGFRITQAYALAVLSLRAALSGRDSQAEQLGRDSLEIPSNPFGQFLAWWALSLALCGLKQGESARLFLSQALQMAVDLRRLGTMTWLLPVVALLEYRAGRHTGALELLSLAFNHPRSATGWIERWALAADMRTDLERKLAPADFQTAWERGKALDLEATAAALLAELEG